MWLRNRFAVSRNLPCSTATLITLLEVEASYASDPLPYFQRLEQAQDTTKEPHTNGHFSQRSEIGVREGLRIA